MHSQPLQKSAIGVDPGNTKLTGAVFSYRLTYNCSSTSGSCLNATIVDLLPPEVQYISTVPASATGDVAAINITPNFMGTGRTRVLFQLINPLPAGNSGDLLVNVRFPNGTTPNGTAAVNTADGTNLGASPGVFTTPPVTVTGLYATPAPDPNLSLTLTTSPANLDMPETYRLRFEVPNTNGVGNFTAAGPVTVTLPPGTVFAGATPAADCQPGCVGTTPATVSWTSPYSLPLGPGQNGDIFLNVTFPSATFPSGTNVTTSAVIGATRLGESPMTYGPTSVTHPVTTFVPAPAMNFSLNMANNTPNPPTLNQSFSYDMNLSNSGNVPLDNPTATVTLPAAMNLSSITTGSYSGLSDFMAGEGVRISYEKNTALGIFTLWGSSPNVTTNTTLTAPPPGLGAGEYMTRIRWQYGQSATGMSTITRPFITGRIINPDHAGGPVAVSDPIQACADLTAVHTAGPTNINRNDCETFNLSGPFVQFNPAKENISGGGPFNIGQNISFRLRVRSDVRSSDPVPLQDIIGTDLLPDAFNFSAWTYDDRGTGLPAPQVFAQIPDFAHTGRTLLRWRWNNGSGNLGVGQEVWINITVTVNNSAVNGTLSNDFTLDSDAAGLTQRCSGNSQTDALDFDGDGNTVETLCRATGTANISAPPRILSITSNETNPTNAPTVSWRVTFNEAVYGVTAANFSLVGIPNAAFTNIAAENNTPNDEVWLVTASTGTGNGSLGLNLTLSDNIRSVSTDRGIMPATLPFTGFVYTIDKTPPTADLSVVSPNIGTTTHTFTVTYSDINGINISTLNNTDIRVTGPNGYDVTPTFINADINSNGSPRTATYSISAPGGVWDETDAGLYVVTWEGNQVADIAGNTNIVSDLGGFTLCPPNPGVTLFVDDDAAAGGNGLSWATAFKTLQEALIFTNQCVNITQIWVAKGTYYPDEGGSFADNDRNASFSMKNGVKIYGGFAGNEPNGYDLSLRNFSTNPTILSGDLDKNDAPNFINREGNSYHVVNNSQLDATALLDGFTITAGNADNETNFPANNAGGMYNGSAGPSVSNCIFTGNKAIQGGAITNFGLSSPTLTNCSFTENKAVAGAGILNYSESNPVILSCRFIKNEAAIGAGMYSRLNCSPQVTNSTFWKNNGGALYDDTGNLLLTNCTFADNQASDFVGTIGVYYSSLKLNNCIVWNNGGLASFITEGGNITLSHCLIEPGSNYYTVEPNTPNPLRVDPLFVDAASGNLRLRACSPAINFGDNTANTSLTDLDGYARKFGIIDLGAYEFQAAPPLPITPIVNFTNPTGCGRNDGSITLAGFSANTDYSVTYKKDALDVPAASFTSDGNGVITLSSLGAGNYTHITATYGACVSSAVTTVLADPVPPAITLGTLPSLCAGSTSTELAYTNATGSPNQYSIDFDAAAHVAGFIDVTQIPLTASPLLLAVPAGAPPAVYQAGLTVRNSTTGCVSSPSPITITIKPVPSSDLIASKVDVCPNTEVTLNAQCSIPTATVQWSPGASTVTPNAPNVAYVYKASCSLAGCTGNESSVEVRTHRILANLKNVGLGPQPKAIAEGIKDNLAPINTISVPTSPRLWTISATGCSVSESAVFKLTGPINFSSIDNNPPYAVFANVGNDYFAIDHPNYGNGTGGFPNGTYTLTVDLRGSDGVGGPFPKNRVAAGPLLATRTLQFTITAAPIREGINENQATLTPELGETQWVSIGQNPVRTEVAVRLSGWVGQRVEMSLTNLQGQTVVQRSVVLHSVQQYEILNVAEIPSGMYILKVLKDNLVKTIKVVKTQ
ncbi:MAG: choice-of-anchor Q domain-containing protein [Spirosomataceae bacterium]